MASKAKTKLSDRPPFQSYSDILDNDVVPSPDFLKEGPNPKIENKPISTSRYYDKSFFEEEVNYVWPHVWQWACREEDIPVCKLHFTNLYRLKNNKNKSNRT